MARPERGQARGEEEEGWKGGREREREGGREGGMLRTVPEPSRTPMGGTALHETLVA